MAITASAKKAIKRSRFLRERNLVFKTAMKKAIKAYRKAAQGGASSDEMKTHLVTVYSAIDKAARKRIIHTKNAARKKSRLAKLAVA